MQGGTACPRSRLLGCPSSVGLSGPARPGTRGPSRPTGGAWELEAKAAPSPLPPTQATRAIHELLLEPRPRIEVQSFFASLFVALLLRTSFLVAVGGAEPVWDQEHGTEGMDPMRYVRLLGRGAGDHAAGPPAEHRPEFSPRHPCVLLTPAPRACPPRLRSTRPRGRLGKRCVTPAYQPELHAQVVACTPPARLLASYVTSETSQPPSRNLRESAWARGGCATPADPRGGPGGQPGAATASPALCRPQLHSGCAEGPDAERWVRGPCVLHPETRGLGAARQFRETP